MSDQFYSANKQGISFKEIVLQHLKTILVLTQSEFRGGFYRTVVKGNITDQEYVPDARKQYIQTVESLSDILLPFFDKEMTSNCEDIEKELNNNLLNYNKKEIRSQDDYEIFITEKLRLMRILFRKLNLLLNRIDYLKGTVYGESSSIVDLDIVAGDDEE